MRVWRRLTFILPAEPSAEESMIALLHDMGCLGAETEAGRVVAWFDRDIDTAALSVTGCRLASSEEVADEPWHERWMEGLEPIPAGRRFLIVPGPDRGAAETGRTIIRLTPGRAFGTGEHATTRLCLELMEERVRSGESLLDIGTGSGILSIAARLLGASPVVAVDTDETAVRVAARNAAANRCGGILFAAASQAALRPGPFDHVVANLDAATLCRVMPFLGSACAADVVVSGILGEQEADVTVEAARQGLRPGGRREEGEWVALVFERRGDV